MTHQEMEQFCAKLVADGHAHLFIVDIPHDDSTTTSVRDGKNTVFIPLVNAIKQHSGLADFLTYAILTAGKGSTDE